MFRAWWSTATAERREQLLRLQRLISFAIREHCYIRLRLLFWGFGEYFDFIPARCRFHIVLAILYSALSSLSIGGFPRIYDVGDEAYVCIYRSALVNPPLLRPHRNANQRYNVFPGTGDNCGRIQRAYTREEDVCEVVKRPRLFNTVYKQKRAPSDARGQKWQSSLGTSAGVW